jgi:hypothetical protein
MKAVPQRGQGRLGAIPAAAPAYPLTEGTLVYYETLHNGLCGCRVAHLTPAIGATPATVKLEVTARSHAIYDRGNIVTSQALPYVLPRDPALYFRRGRTTYVRPFRWIIGNEVKQ